MDPFDQSWGAAGAPRNGQDKPSERKSILDEFLESQSSSVVPETRFANNQGNSSARQPSSSRPQSARRSDGAKPPTPR